MAHLWKPVTPAGKSFAAALAESPSEVLLAFDFDGTLAPIVDDPEQSRLHDQAARELSRLGSLVQVAIITGRPVEAVRRLGALDQRPGMERVVVLGQYGVERYDVATGEVRLPEVSSTVAAALRETQSLLEEWAAKGHDVEGIRIEDKARAVAVHTRQHATPDQAHEQLKSPLRAIANRHGLSIEPGRLVWELRSAREDKGDALRELVEEFKPRHVAFAGDDLGDLPAFEALEDLRAEGVRCCAVVSASKEQPSLSKYADVLCEGPAGIAAWMGTLQV